MPKKTKREKILAEAHRKALGTVSPLVSSAVTPALPLTTAPAYMFQPHGTTPQTVSSPSDTAEYRAIKIDLVKTLVLAAAAISIEFLVYLKLGR